MNLAKSIRKIQTLDYDTLVIIQALLHNGDASWDKEDEWAALTAVVDGRVKELKLD